MAEKILIIDDDLDTLRLVGLMLQQKGYQILAANNGPQGLEQAKTKPDLIILDVMMPGMDGYEVAKRLRGNPATAAIPILMFTAKAQLDDKVSGFESGADDYLTKPVHPPELQAHVKTLLARAASKPGTPATSNVTTGRPTEQPAYVVGVLAARGGVGVTTLGLNLASALTQRAKNDVIFAELRPGQGTAAFDLNIPNPQGLTNLLLAPSAEITRDKIKENIITHESGLRMLLASYSPKDAALATTAADRFEIILSRLRFMARFVVVDLGTSLTANTQKLLKACNEIVVVTEPMAASIIITKDLIAGMTELGIDRRRIVTVLNYRLRSDLQLSVNQVVDNFGQPIAVTFTPAAELIVQAARKNTTAFAAQPEGLTGQQYTTLANQIIEHVTQTNAPK